MRLISGRVFLRQRIGQIWVEQQMMSVPRQQKTALTQPPQAKSTFMLWRGFDIGQ
jgi:hypothetical protein